LSIPQHLLRVQGVYKRTEKEREDIEEKKCRTSLTKIKGQISEMKKSLNYKKAEFNKALLKLEKQEVKKVRMDEEGVEKQTAPLKKFT